MKTRDMKAQINILVIVKSIDGGTGTFLLNFLKIGKIFKDRSVNITTLVLERPSYRLVKDKNLLFFRKKGYYPQHYSLTPRNFIAFYNEMVWIRKQIRIYGPQIIMGIDMRCNLLAIITKLFSIRPIKVIATNHIDLGRMIFDKSTPLLNLIFRNVIKNIYSRADALVGVSKDLSKNLINDFRLKKRVITIYNGLNIKKFTPRTKPNSKKMIIVNVARLCRQKDHTTLIHAFKILQDSMPNVELWILGNGPKRKDLEQLVKRLNLSKKVRLMGWVHNVESYVKRADLFILSSKIEGFGYTIVEAMQVGLPVISTDTPYGPSEILGGGKYGITIPMGEPDKMKQAMFRLLNDINEYRYFSGKSIERSRYFSIDRMLLGYKLLITKLIS